MMSTRLTVKSTVSEIINVYPRLKACKFDMSNFSNHDMNLLARVVCDEFRYAMVAQSSDLLALSPMVLLSRDAWFSRF
jgi:hypothetical protein